MPLTLSRPYRPSSELLSTFGWESVAGGAGGRFVSTTTSASTLWPTANLAIYVPVEIPETTTYVKAWVINGTVAAGNVDIGLYDEGWVLKASTGATLVAGTSAMEEIDLTDFTVTAGRYYLGISCSLNTNTVFAQTAAVAGKLAALGCAQEASAHPLPATATPVLMAQTIYPEFGFARRTLVAT